VEKSQESIVVALGGNAISVPSEEGSIPQQFARSRETAKHLADAIERGFHLILTHGNGPQVGNILRRVEIASPELYAIPLEVCVADTQAGMGYMIAQCLTNELRQRGIKRSVTTLVTTVLVDREDPAFKNPTKPIGSRMCLEDAQLHQQRDGWNTAEVEPNQFRRIVPSPTPLAILELGTIQRLVRERQLIVCCGGGGIPVYETEDGSQQGAGAVIDKDYTSALLAALIDVSRLFILTAVPRVYANYNTPNQEPLSDLTAVQAKRYLDDGQFGAGSMSPKIEAALEFLKTSPQSDASVVITSAEHLVDAIDGQAGTCIHR
jgi:carbamate kinase